jgi:hypothetical protein
MPPKRKRDKKTGRFISNRLYSTPKPKKRSGGSVGCNIWKDGTRENVKATCLQQNQQLKYPDNKIDRALAYENDNGTLYNSWYQKTIDGVPAVCSLDDFDGEINDSCVPKQLWFEHVYKPKHNCSSLPTSAACRDVAGGGFIRCKSGGK